MPNGSSGRKAPVSRETFDGFFETALSKSQRRQLVILEATIGLLASQGIEAATYERIAVKAGASRALVQHYFPDRTELVLTVMKYVRGRLQTLAASAIAAEASPTGKLLAYVESTFAWLKKFPDDARAWLLFYYYCSFQPEFRKLNSELVDTGHRRICGLLEMGIASGEFSVSDIPATAKILQGTITAGLLQALTERPPPFATLKDLTTRYCLRLTGRDA